ncbi:TrpR, YerC/YecD [Patescibacteria group bacterium]|nr:TrpR, YerC/YecD [Patescibacteria group bacterium]
MAKWDNQKTEDLLAVILQLKNKAEAKKFFRDLLTEAELREFGNRWRAVQMLAAKIPYTEITKETGLSSTTVARISRWLQKGQGGYKLMLKRTANKKVVHQHHSTSSGKRVS